MNSFGLADVRVQGFRSARDVVFRPQRICALVGDANAGKSNLLRAIRALLDTRAAPLTAEDAATDGDRRIRIEGTLAGQSRRIVASFPPEAMRAAGEVPPVLFLPAELRTGSVAAPGSGGGAADDARALLTKAIAEITGPRDSRNVPSDATGANALVGAAERCCDARLEGMIVLIEEPELYLRPQAQRYLDRLLHSFADLGNQVIYSTHAPGLLNVARLVELAIVERSPETGTKVLQPQGLTPDEEFRALSEVDAERGELFLSRAAVLVEGRTEKLTLPFVFRALGRDADREAITIVDCGGKSNIPLFARICHAAGIPFVAVHDRDAPAGRQPIEAERHTNELIARVAGRRHCVVLEPDFEGVADLRGHDHKPEQAWRRFKDLPASEIPAPLARVVRLATELARD